MNILHTSSGMLLLYLIDVDNYWNPILIEQHKMGVHVSDIDYRDHTKRWYIDIHFYYMVDGMDIDEYTLEFILTTQQEYKLIVKLQALKK